MNVSFVSLFTHISPNAPGMSEQFFSVCRNLLHSVFHILFSFSRVVLGEKRTIYLKFQMLSFTKKKSQPQLNAGEREIDNFNMTQNEHRYIDTSLTCTDMYLMGTTINLTLLSKKSHHCQPFLAKGNEIHLQMKNNFLFFKLIEEIIDYWFPNNSKQNSHADLKSLPVQTEKATAISTWG